MRLRSTADRRPASGFADDPVTAPEHWRHSSGEPHDRGFQDTRGDERVPVTPMIGNGGNAATVDAMCGIVADRWGREDEDACRAIALIGIGPEVGTRSLAQDLAVAAAGRGWRTLLVSEEVGAHGSMTTTLAVPARPVRTGIDGLVLLDQAAIATEGRIAAGSAIAAIHALGGRERLVVLALDLDRRTRDGAADAWLRGLDGAFLVARRHASTRQQLRGLLEQLAAAGVAQLGTVMT